MPPLFQIIPSSSKQMISNTPCTEAPCLSATYKKRMTRLTNTTSNVNLHYYCRKIIPIQMKCIIPCSIEVSREFSMFDKFSLLYSFLHDFPRDKIIIPAIRFTSTGFSSSMRNWKSKNIREFFQQLLHQRRLARSGGTTEYDRRCFGHRSDSIATAATKCSRWCTCCWWPRWWLSSRTRIPSDAPSTFIVNYFGWRWWCGGTSTKLCGTSGVLSSGWWRGIDQ